MTLAYPPLIQQYFGYTSFPVMQCIPTPQEQNIPPHLTSLWKPPKVTISTAQIDTKLYMKTIINIIKVIAITLHTTSSLVSLPAIIDTLTHC